MRNPTPRAFTLVELLVVIGIIAILVSLLIPALGRAKSQANIVKCQTQLREIFSCFKFYELEYKGYWPVARLNGIRIAGTPRPYDVDGVPYMATAPGIGQGYYFNILSKYATKARMGNAAGTDIFQADSTRKTIFFGCPAWTGYFQDGTAPVGDTNLVQPGYGMNIFPTYTPTYPTGATVYPPQVAANRSKEVAVMDAVNENPTGNFLKAKVWSNPQQRMLLGDSRFWLAQSGRPPASADNSYPPSITYQPAVFNTTAGVGNTQQSTIDMFRHGKPPPLQGTVFDLVGGKVSYNILYADGHVANATDGREAYRSIRMKFPG